MLPTQVIDINKRAESLHEFVPVPLDKVKKLYYGAFVRYIDKENVMYYGGYIIKVKYTDNDMILELSETDDGQSEVFDVKVLHVMQMWKRIDYAYFELLEMRKQTLEPMLAKIQDLEKLVKN
jgi:hypothetical protein